MEPQEDEDLTRRLAEIEWLSFQGIAEQDPTLTRLKRVLEQNHAIQQMDARALLAFCADLEARYAADSGRESSGGEDPPYLALPTLSTYGLP